MSTTPSMAHVYVFEAETGLVKIGYTINPEQRVKKIQTSSGFKITQQFISPLCSNYREVERNLHKQFADHRHQGEWFAIEFQTAVEALNQLVLETGSPIQLLSFHFGQNDMRTIIFDKNGNPWFVANDACKILAIVNPRDAVSRLDDDEKMTVVITDSLIKQGFSSNAPGTSLNLINEYGLYALILSSRKPEAKRFKRWVIHEVLPAIRKTGKYEVNSSPPILTRRPEYQDFDNFVAECFIADSAGLVSAGNIYIAYKEWCQRHQRPVYSHKLLGQYLKEMSYVPAKRTHGKYFWLGIRLKLQESLAKSAVDTELVMELENYLQAFYRAVKNEGGEFPKGELLALLKTATDKVRNLK